MCEEHNLSSHRLPIKLPSGTQTRIFNSYSDAGAKSTEKNDDLTHHKLRRSLLWRISRFGSMRVPTLLKSTK
ncbi:UNVERIFIED_CONTAM: hypothetical protein HHA_452170 [Hammondia hammondi]|eukprot:XP_008885217.1 hypothetical protein HHA_452170 [Hammondia hammondi]